MHMKRRLPIPTDPLLGAAAFHDDVATTGDGIDARLPSGNRLGVRVRVDLPAEVVDDDRHVRVRRRQLGKHRQAFVVGRVVVEAQVVLAEQRVALLELRVEVRRKGAADAAEVGRSGEMCLEHRRRGRAGPQIGGAEDPRAQACAAVLAGAAHRGNAVYELRFPDATHLLRTVGPVERTALGEDRLHHPVAGCPDLLRHLFAEVDVLLPWRRFPAHVPQMVMGIDDRRLRLQHVFRLLLCQPFLQRSVLGVGHCNCSRFLRVRLRHTIQNRGHQRPERAAASIP